MIWMTSDLHFSHANIIAYCGRPYKNSHYMNKDLIEKYNNKVKPEDTCYILGDLTLLGRGETFVVQRLVEQLNGTKVLILGNHDKLDPFAYCEMGFDSVHTKLTLHPQEITLVHDPAACIMDKGNYLVGHCFDSQTEVLTREGWTSYNKLKPGVEIVSLNQESNFLEFNPITALLISNQHKVLYVKDDIKSPINFAVTSEHDMLVRKFAEPLPGFRKIEANQLTKAKYAVFVPVSGILPRPGANLTDDEIRLLAWIIADGNLDRFGKAGAPRFHLVKQRKIQRLEALLASMNIPYHKGKGSKETSIKIRLYTRNSPIVQKLVSMLMANKRLWDDYLQMSPEQATVFLTEYGHTDGTFQAEDHMQLFTSDPIQAERLQILATLSGHRCAVYTRHNNRRFCYAGSKSTSYICNISLNKTRHVISTGSIHSESYNGYTWCVQVPLGTVLCRRNGKTLITGNCHTLFKEFKTPERHLINVGVDVWGYEPVDLESLVRLFKYQNSVED